MCSATRLGSINKSIQNGKKPNPNTMFAKVNRIEFEGLGVNKSGQQIKPKPQSRHERQSKLNKVRSFGGLFSSIGEYISHIISRNRE